MFSFFVGYLLGRFHASAVYDRITLFLSLPVIVIHILYVCEQLSILKMPAFLREDSIMCGAHSFCDQSNGFCFYVISPMVYVVLFVLKCASTMILPYLEYFSKLNESDIAPFINTSNVSTATV
jgi:hypothetical protein